MAQVSEYKAESPPDGRQDYRHLQRLRSDQGAHGADQPRRVNANVKRAEGHRQQRKVEFEAEEFELLVRAYRRSGQGDREQRAEQINPEERRRLTVSLREQKRDDLVPQNEHQRADRDDHQRQFAHGVQPDRNNGAPLARRRKFRHFRDQRAAERSGQQPEQRQLKQSGRIDREPGGREEARDHEAVLIALRGLRKAAESERQRVADLRLEQRRVEGVANPLETLAEAPPDVD